MTKTKLNKNPNSSSQNLSGNPLANQFDSQLENSFNTGPIEDLDWKNPQLQSREYGSLEFGGHHMEQENSGKNSIISQHYESGNANGIKSGYGFGGFASIHKSTQSRLGFEFWQILSLISVVLIVSSGLIWFSTLRTSGIIGGSNQKRLLNQAKAEVFVDFQSLQSDLARPVKITKTEVPDSCFSHLQKDNGNFVQLEQKKEQIKTAKQNLTSLTAQISYPSATWQNFDKVFNQYLDKAQVVIENHTGDAQQILVIQKTLSLYCSATDLEEKEKLLLDPCFEYCLEALYVSSNQQSQQYAQSIREWLASEGDTESPDFLGFFVQPKLDFEKAIEKEYQEFVLALGELENQERASLSEGEIANLNLIFVGKQFEKNSK